MQKTKQKQGYNPAFVSYSPPTPDDILTSTITSKPPIPKGASIIGRGTRNNRGVTTRRQRREFLGNVRQDSIFGVFNRDEIIYGKKKVRKTERQDAKTVRGLTKKRRSNTLGDILPPVKPKKSKYVYPFSPPKSKKGNNDIFLPPFVNPKKGKYVDPFSPPKSKKKTKKSEWDGWF